MKKLNEECYEFLEAVDNYEDMLLLNNKTSTGDKALARSFVVEEMADVLILLTQFAVKYNIAEDDLDAFINVKLTRTMQRINEGYYDKKEN